MINTLTVALTAAALLAAAWSALLMALGKPLTLDTGATLGLAGLVLLLEVGLLAQAVIGVVGVVGTERQLDAPTFTGYLVAPVLVLPCAAVWSVAERTRWGSGVLLVACLSVPVMILRLHQIWSGQG